MELRSTRSSKRELNLEDGKVLGNDKIGYKTDSVGRKNDVKVENGQESNDDRFNFDDYLADGVPEHFTINIASNHDAIPSSATLLYNAELDGVGKPLGDSYKLDLVDLTQKQKDVSSNSKNKHWRKALRTQSERNHSGSNNNNINNNINLSSDPFTQNTGIKRKQPKGWVDPLSNKLYDVAHRRKEMKERKFGAADRTKSLSEFDECMNAMEKLGRSVKLKARLSLKEQYHRIMKQHLDNKELENLAKVLPELTRVENTSDLNEVCIKYKLTVKELMKFIIRFEDIRIKEQSMKRARTEIRQHRAEPVVDTDDDESTDPINLKEFRERSRKRLRKRNKKYGKIIKVHFYDGVTLVIDPVYNPNVIRD